MEPITYLFPEGKKKVLTFSYDDGVEQDIRLVKLFNDHKLKATFNLNSGIQHENHVWFDKGVPVRRMNKEGLVDLYKGHEVAVHSLTHPHLEHLSTAGILKELLEDKKNLEKQYGYLIRGSAYPFGTYDERVLEALKVVGIEYARTVKDHHSFILPDNFLEWHPTCHHKDKLAESLAKRFVEEDSLSLSLFYIWGHSYEFDMDNNWEHMEKLCATLSHKEDIWYATNIEIVDYMHALYNLKVSSDETMIYNPSAITVWVKMQGKVIAIEPNLHYAK